MCGFLDIVFDKGFQDRKTAKMTGFVGGGGDFLCAKWIC